MGWGTGRGGVRGGVLEVGPGAFRVTLQSNRNQLSFGKVDELGYNTVCGVGCRVWDVGTTKAGSWLAG